MPKLRRVSGAEAIRALERLSFKKVRQRGGHVVLRSKRRKALLDAWSLCAVSWQSAHCVAFYGKPG